MIELIGLIGSIAFGISGVPQAIKSWRDGHTNGVAHGTVILWLLGEFAMLSYTLIKYPTDLILLSNYGINALVVSVIAYYKYKKFFW